jgi:NAD(P)H-hydrate repair Nnr-like enzyme with NAD(P)H-hydrate dehydratase domain
LHGASGDIAAQKNGYQAMNATDIVVNLNNAWKTLSKS